MEPARTAKDFVFLSDRSLSVACWFLNHSMSAAFWSLNQKKFVCYCLIERSLMLPYLIQKSLMCRCLNQKNLILAQSTLTLSWNCRNQQPECHFCGRSSCSSDGRRSRC